MEHAATVVRARLRAAADRRREARSPAAMADRVS
jgi:hypothetical protein